MRSRGAEDILTTVVSQKLISLHTNIHLQLKSKSISLCETEAPWWVLGNKFCWWVALHGPIDWETERWWSFDLRLMILLYSLFIVSVHGYFVLPVEVVVEQERRITYEWLSSITHYSVIHYALLQKVKGAWHLYYKLVLLICNIKRIVSS